MSGASHYAYLTDEVFEDPRLLADTFRKLHRQFGHTSPHRLAKTILQAYPHVEKAKLAKVVETFTCRVCGEHARPVKRPVGASTRIPDFNAEVGADIFHVDGVHFLHVICLFTLYCQVEKLVNMQGEYVRGKFVRVWQRYFGAPKKLKLDLGPEFDNTFIEQMRDILGCEIIGVPGGAHWSHGTTENKHGLLREMVQKMLKDNPGLDPAEAMDACVAAKNCTVNVYGFSPIQLAFGYAPTIPFFPSKQAEETDEELSLVYKGYLRDRLQRMQDARILALGVMAKHRIKRALQKPVRADRDALVVGDKVDWYTEHSLKTGTGEWKGPGRLGLLNPPMAIVLAGGRMVRRHVIHVRHTLSDTGLDVDGREHIVAHENDPEVGVEQCQEAEQMADVPVQQADVEEKELTGQECIDQYPELWQQFSKLYDDTIKTVDHEEPEQIIPEEVPSEGRRVTRSMSKKEALVGMLAMVSIAKLLKAKKKRAQEIGGAEVDTEGFDEARQCELQSFIDTGTYDEIDDDGRNAISTRWVYSYKPLPDGGQKPKARLVARGYEDKDIHLIETASPTCTKAHFRLALALCCVFGWTPNHIDIKTAFLQGKPLERDVYLRPPKDHYKGKPGKLWKLKKSVYGLGDAPRK